MQVCNNCGKAFSFEAMYCPHCGLTPYNVGRLCARGHQNPPIAHFCQTCGTSDMKPLAPRIPLKSKLMTLATALCSSLLFALLMTFLFHTLPLSSFTLVVAVIGSFVVLVIFWWTATRILSRAMYGVLREVMPVLLIGCVKLTLRVILRTIRLMFRTVFK